MKRKHLLEKIKSLGGFHVEDLKSKLVSTIMDSLSDEQRNPEIKTASYHEDIQDQCNEEPIPLSTSKI